MRDVYYLMSVGIIELFSELTSIPSGQAWLDFPPKEYLNGNNYKVFPSVGIVELHSKTVTNRYGTIHYSSPSGVATEYEPMGEVIVDYCVKIFTENKYQRRAYKPLINQWFHEYSARATTNDVLDNQYFRIQLLDIEQSESYPYELHYYIRCSIQDFKETSGLYMVDEVKIYGNASQSNDVEASGVVTELMLTVTEDD